MSEEPSEFDKGYIAGLMQAHSDVDAWCRARLDRLEPGKSMAYRDEIDSARVQLLHLLRHHLPGHVRKAYERNQIRKQGDMGEKQV